jgi:hypothetical protein
MEKNILGEHSEETKCPQSTRKKPKIHRGKEYSKVINKIS